MISTGTDDLFRLARERADFLEAEVRQLQAEREEVEFQLHGGTDVDGPVSRGLDGLDLPGKANVVHFTAVDALIEVYELRAEVRRLQEALHVIRDAHEPPDRPGASCAEGCFGRWPCVAWFEADVALSTPDRGDDDE